MFVSLVNLQKLALRLAQEEGSTALFPRHYERARSILAPESVRVAYCTRPPAQQRSRPVTPRKLSDATITAIRLEREVTGASLRQLAAQYNTCHRTIWFVVNRKGAYRDG